MAQTETSDTVNDFLLGGGGATAKFPTIGTVHVGTILNTELRDQTNMETGEVLKWPDGNPRKQIVVTIQTEESDPEIEDDDGIRKLYAKGQLLAVLREAARPHGGLRNGGKIRVKYEADGKAETKGFNPPKQYSVKYLVPAFDVDEVPFEPESKNSDWGDPPRTGSIAKKAPLGDRLNQGDVGAFWAQTRDAGFTREQVLDTAGLDIKTGSLAGLSEGELNILRVKLGITE